MTDRDKQYLDLHNEKRKYWHAHYNKAYVPIKWSRQTSQSSYISVTYYAGLKDSAMEYAKELLNSCLTGPPEHAKGNPWGENIARNKGSPTSWGRQMPPDGILARFVDREVGLDWSRNSHMTGVLWRASKYVRCAETETLDKIANGSTHACRAQVCRYAKPGNCAMGRYRNADGTIDWKTPMLMDDSPCTPNCPPEGFCYDD
ncbi:hypothetical protein ACHAWF_004887 [Thalassiosira exigua]